MTLPSSSPEAPPSAALRYLSPQQRAQFEAFRSSLIVAKLYTPGDPPSHDDATLLRFLRARRFDPLKAREQFANTEKWRKENDVDRLYATFPVEEMQRAKLFYPRWTGRRDKSGVPVYVYRLASLDSAMQKELHATPERRRYERIVALWEFMRTFALPLCSHLPHSALPSSPIPPSALPPSLLSEASSVQSSTSLANDSPIPTHDTPAPNSSSLLDVPATPNGTSYSHINGSHSKDQIPITSVFSIIDLGGVSLTTMWSLRHHLQQASELATAHYPETLHRIAVVNAPHFFGTVWGWIKVWFDEGTRNKVHVLDSNPGPTLLNFIDAANLPRTYGGELDFNSEDEPVLDDAAIEALGGDEIPAGPVVFLGERGWSRPEGFVERVSGETVVGDAVTVVADGDTGSLAGKLQDVKVEEVKDKSQSKRRWLFSSA